jgi:hypothetical protein
MSARHAVVTGAAILAFAGAAGAAVIDFNTAGDFEANFNHSATVPYVEADGVGIGGSRGLSITAITDAGATLKTSSFPFNELGTSLSSSIYFHTVPTLGTTGDVRVLETNFVATETSSVTSAHTGVGGKLQFLDTATDDSDDVEIEFRRNNADVAGSIPSQKFDILPGRWYKATFTMTNAGTDLPIPATFVLDDYGTTGTALEAAKVYSHSFAIPIEAVLTADDAVFGAFRTRDASRLYDALDNFEVAVVPEPAGLAAAFAAGCLAVLRRRTRRATV